MGTRKSTAKEAAIEETNTAEERSYTKGALLKSGEFKNKKDLINTLLSDEEKYTKAKAREIINKFMKGGVC